MKTHELRNLDEARRFVWQGLWLQRALCPTAATVKPALEWSLEIASQGDPLPPIGLVADLGHVAFGLDHEARGHREALVLPGLPSGLARTYEDYVLGKVYADWTFERAGDALRRYQGRDRARGLAFLINQFRTRAGFEGVILSPGVIRGAVEMPPDQLLAQGWESLTREGLMPLLPQLYESLIGAARRAAEMLGSEDIFELEHGTALAELGQRVALRQVLQAAIQLEATLPRHRVRPLAGRQVVPTRVLDEDTYPVGGYSSLSTRGSIESLLHSQLAYMEKEDRPDLFDVKFLRDELLYYARDENQFLRRRRCFVVALYPDLVQARFKDAALPYQRIVLLLALLVVAIRKLTEWLSTDSLLFEFLLVEEKEAEPLGQEQHLLEMLLREPIANGTVVLRKVTAGEVQRHCTLRARRSLCQLLTVSAIDRSLVADGTGSASLRIDDARPALHCADDLPVFPEAADPLESWALDLERLLQLWV